MLLQEKYSKVTITHRLWHIPWQEYKKMKKRIEMLKKMRLFFIAFTISISLFSCSDSTLNGPIQKNSSVSYSSEHLNSFQKENPSHKRLKSSKNESITKKIDWKKGGVIQFTHIYKEKKKIFVKVTGVLIIPPHAFHGKKNITLIDDYKTASIYCYPSMTFDKPIYMNLIFVGLNISEFGFTNDNVIFGYIEEEGEVEPCINDGITLDPSHGALGVIRAEIHHFSRYAFCR